MQKGLSHHSMSALPYGEPAMMSASPSHLRFRPLHMLRIRKMHSIHISQPIHIIEAVAAVIFMVSIHVVQVKTGRRIIGQSVLVLIIRIYGVYQHIKSLLSGFSVRMPERRPFYSLRPAVSGMIPVSLAVIDIT